MATYVVCHGGWDGGWQWKDVADLLRAAGHEVYTPTYTGLGERSHLLSPDIDLHTHIQDILMVLRFEDLTDVVLVGHSYGGMVITGVAEKAAGRLAHLVYLDAFAPQDGQSLADMYGPEAWAGFEQWANADGDGWLLPYDAPDADRQTAHPFKTCLTPVEVKSPLAAALPRTFICCTETTGDFCLPITRSAEMAKADDRWRYRELKTGHDPQLMPRRELVDLLLEIA
jgi:pimeloyl-ACP methyl ester carboxylesterase